MRIKYILEDGNSLRMGKDKNLERGSSIKKINLFIRDSLVKERKMVLEY